MKPYMCLLQACETALHKAAKKGHCDILRLLIDTGMALDINGYVSCYMHIYVIC